MRGRRAETHSRGQSLVELSISLTVMLLLVAGAVSFGMAYFSYVSIRDAAQEGALYGSISPFVDLSTPLNGLYDTGEPVNSPGICDRIQHSSSSPVDLSTFACDVTADGLPPNPAPNMNVIYVQGAGDFCQGGSPPNAITVSVRYIYPIFMPFVGAIIGRQNIPLTATVTDTILEPRCTSP
jgi:hypothetical protein